MSGTVAATNPLIAQGVLNRIAGRITFGANSSLNVQPYNMGPSGIKLSVAGKLTDMIQTMTGLVTSPAPYVPVDVRIPILRTQPLGNAWLAQMQLYSAVGPMTVYTDATNYGTYNISNGAVTDIDQQSFDGKDPVITYIIQGAWVINNQMWQLS